MLDGTVKLHLHITGNLHFITVFLSKYNIKVNNSVHLCSVPLFVFMVTESDGAVQVARRHSEERARGHDAAVRVPEAPGGHRQRVRVAHRLARQWQQAHLRHGL